MSGNEGLIPVGVAGEAVTGERLVAQGANRFRVHTRAYTDRTLFDAEMERIFNRVWVFVGLESELPEIGDFKSTFIGLQPVVVTRADDGRIHVLVNRCVHRGAVMVREGRGKACELQCPYHGWVYRLDGKLVAVSERRDPGGYSDAFDEPEGLYRVPRVESYRGFIFASFNSGVAPLEQALGRARVMIDRRLAMSPTGEIELRSKPYVARYPGNWKFMIENINDAYHFMHTHKGFVALQARYGDTTGDFGLHKGGSGKSMREYRFKGSTWDIPGGHAQIERPAEDLQRDLDGPLGDYYRVLLDIHGREAMEWIAGKTSGTVFPNMGMIHQQIRVWRPIAPDLTEVEIYPYEVKGAPPAFNEGMLRSQERFYGPSGYGMSDDVDIFARNQQGLAGSAVEWMILERGIDTDERLPDGDIRGLPSSEAPQRAPWREWLKLMTRA
jgi:phenylpropionate dioxygenase-like ring-hydroxylating dioxygenase large terminal subunit